MIRKSSPLRVSPKRLKALGGKPPYSTIKKRPRKPSEFARIYGSKERVRYVKSLACVCCGRTGFSDNAHIETGGTGRKADYTKIVPLCGHLTPKFSCHDRMHRHGREDVEMWGGINLDQCAEATEKLWQESQQ